MEVPRLWWEHGPGTAEASGLQSVDDISGMPLVAGEWPPPATGEGVAGQQGGLDPFLHPAVPPPSCASASPPAHAPPFINDGVADYTPIADAAGAFASTPRAAAGSVDSGGAEKSAAAAGADNVDTDTEDEAPLLDAALALQGRRRGDGGRATPVASALRLQVQVDPEIAAVVPLKTLCLPARAWRRFSNTYLKSFERPLVKKISRERRRIGQILRADSAQARDCLTQRLKRNRVVSSKAQQAMERVIMVMVNVERERAEIEEELSIIGDGAWPP